MDKLLKFDGRIRRMGWWIAGIAVTIISGVVDNIRDQDDQNIIVLLVLAIVGLVIWLIGISISVRRWHDHNMSGWWLLVNFIPIIGWVYTLIMLGFMSGSRGSNKYGPPPEEGAIL